MHVTDSILERFPNPNLSLQQIYQNAKPTSNLVLDHFLDKALAIELANECINIPSEHWTKFTRNGSHMLECKNLVVMQRAREVVEQLNGSQFISWLEALTGINGLLPDPHLTGAGYSRSFQNDTLQIHNDFNWNDQLQLHRAVSLIIYLTPGWLPEWNGGLEFYDTKQTHVVKTVDCLFNRALIWNYSPVNYHGYTKPILCPPQVSRNTLRLFYYVSNSTYRDDDPPHRSQYWYDPDTQTAYDKRDHP